MVPKWTRSGSEVDRKWTGSGPEVDRKWTRSCPEVNQKLPGSGHVCPSVCLSALSLPPYARDLQAQGTCALRFFIVQFF